MLQAIQVPLGKGYTIAPSSQNKAVRQFMDLVIRVRDAQSHEEESQNIRDAAVYFAGICFEPDQQKIVSFFAESGDLCRNDQAMQQAYAKICSDAIDTRALANGELSLLLLPVQAQTNPATTHMELPSALARLKLAAALQSALCAGESGTGWVYLLPQMLHQSILREVDLAAWILVKDAAHSCVQQNFPKLLNLRVPTPARREISSDQRSALYFIPFVRFQPYLTGNAAETVKPAPDWGRVTRMLDGWLADCACTPFAGDSSGVYPHGVPVTVSQVFSD